MIADFLIAAAGGIVVGIMLAMISAAYDDYKLNRSKPVPRTQGESPMKEVEIVNGVRCMFDEDEGIYRPIENDEPLDEEENPESVPTMPAHFGGHSFQSGQDEPITQASLIAALVAAGVHVPKAPEPRQPRFTWVRPLLTRLVKALPKASLWAALLGLVFAHEVRLGFLVEGQDASWLNLPGLEELLGEHVVVYIQAGVAALVVALSYVVLPGRAKVEHKL